ncbi:hypothetical protein [Yinghuangia soli]|uniref:Uncharacterized protein n=1 Tax=Yinghuangia soli TaxID=2908204 RepID=A0AA41Q2J3_9ACTN|nr:hypothetical protein [Yinghuangia soli]MCF2530374.1 hypothetical protein [Yinghuangia soli]
MDDHSPSRSTVQFPAPARSRSHGRPALVCAAAAALILGLSGCGENDPATAGNAAAPEVPAATGAAGDAGTGTALADSDAAKEAATAADRWEAAHRPGAPTPPFVVRSSLAGSTGIPEGENPKFKVSILSGCVTLGPQTVVPEHPDKAEITSDYGTRWSRPYLDPKTAAKPPAPVSKDVCGSAGAPNLTISRVALNHQQVLTSEGYAKVPVWELGFAETTARETVLAVPSDRGPDQGPQDTSVQVSADGRTLTVKFFGSEDVPGPCGADYYGAAAERTGVVAVAVGTLPRPTADAKSTDSFCTLVAHTRTVTITLPAPLGDRALIGSAGEALKRG